MDGRRGWLFAVIATLALAGCLESSSKTCPSDRVCPSGTVCVSFGCVLPSQIASCKGLSDGAECVLSDDKKGQCREAACISIGCGNGLLEMDEACDDGNTTGSDGCSARCDSDETCGNAFLDTAKSEGCDCGSASFTGTRPPGCDGKPNSDAPDTVCTSTCQIRGCGDGVIGGLEDCDGAALGGKSCTDVGFYGGTLGCKSSCRFDVSTCAGTCGDGTRNGSPIEKCDGPDLNLTDCTTFGYYSATGLACNALCNFDTSGCSGYCGDLMYQAGKEACDPVETETDLNNRGLDCTDFGFYSAGGLKCSSSCQIDTSGCLSGRCGDGALNTPQEECDTTVPATTDCTDFGYYVAGSAGNVICRDNCTLDSGGCATAMVPHCGDSTINGPEQCDGTTLGGKACTDFGYYNGTLTCSAACTYDLSQCSERCGDGIINGSEQCDGNASIPGTENCKKTFGYYNADPITCSGQCTYSAAGCANSGYCGDKIVNGPEDCDGSPPSSTCSDLGYDGGRAGCTHFCTPDPAECDRFGWWSSPPPASGLSLTAITGTAYNNVWALSLSSVYHYDGTSWSALPDVVGSYQMTLWASSPTDLWAAGFQGSVRHWNGATWTNVDTGNTSAQILGLWGASPTNIFAVGNDGNAGGLIFRYTGTWSSFAPLGSASLRAVWGSSATNAIAVGDGGAAYHWDGVTWTKMTTGATNPNLTAVWGSSPTDVWAVGYGGNIWHYDGGAANTWSLYMNPPTSANLTGIWGTAANQVFAVGGAYLHYDGTSWQLMPSQAPLAFGVWGSGADDVWAVNGSTMAHFAGHWLRPMTPPAGSKALYGVWSAAANDVFIVGQSGTILHYDGVSCTVMTTSDSTGVNLRSVWGSSPTNVFAVGDSLSSGTIERWTGPAISTPWAPLSSNTPGYLRSVWGANATNVFASAANGDIMKWDGSVWSLSTATGLSVEGLWGTSASNVFAAGYNLRRFNGASWSLQWPDPILNNAITGWGTTLVLTGGNGPAYRFDGTSWFRSQAPLANMTNGLWAQSANSAFAVGTTGALAHWDGAGWIPMRSGATSDLRAVSGAGTAVHIVGDSSTAVELDNYCGPKEFRCSNEWDDDCDGLINCQDSDCATDPFCVSGGLCANAQTVTCSSSTPSSNVGGAKRIDGYGCGGSRSETGPEVAFRFVAAATQSVTVNVQKNADLDLAVITTTGGTCDPQACVGANYQTLSTALDDQVTFNAVSGKTYYFIVDGADPTQLALGAVTAAPFTLTVTCN